MQKKRALASTVLVTVCGPEKILDLELPGDVTVGELLPVLLEIYTSQEKPLQKEPLFPISLQMARENTPLVPDRTLAEAGVCDGTVLVLQTPASAESLAPRQFVPRSVRPTLKTGGIGVTWESLE